MCTSCSKTRNENFYSTLKLLPFKGNVCLLVFCFVVLNPSQHFFICVRNSAIIIM